MLADLEMLADSTRRMHLCGKNFSATVWVSTTPMGILGVSTPPFLEDENIFQKIGSPHGCT
jgi:hypothetical protein